MAEFIDSLVITKKLLIGVIFPPIVVMLVFVILNFRKISNNKNLPLLFGLYLFVMLFIVKITLTIQGSMISMRYCYDLIFPAIIISIPGLYFGAEFVCKILKKIKLINKRVIFWILVLAVIISCIGKALSPPDIKPKTEMLVTEMLKATRGKNFVLITEYEPNTFKYLLKNSTVIDLNIVLNPNHPEYFDYAIKHIANIYKCPIFLTVEFKDSDFRALFMNSEADFPLKLVSEAKDKKHSYSLYIYQ